MADHNDTTFALHPALFRALLGRRLVCDGHGRRMRMGTRPLAWPHHGVAVDARNDTAEILVQIIDECVTLQALLAEDARPEGMELMVAVAKMQQRATTGLLLMVEQGAPVHPSRLK